MSTDRHSGHFMVLRGEEREEFKHLEPAHMARILLAAARRRRSEERARLKRLQSPQPIKNVPGVVSIGPAAERLLQTNLERLDVVVEHLEAALELMNREPLADRW